MSPVLAATAAQTIRDYPIPQIRALDVAESDDEVVVRGLVASYFHKQLAQEAIMPVLGERRLRNLVTVSRIS
ncbi:MAG: BON domain-containing protein [Gemmataceae bacterium]|jgi:hypothetical protein|nr:BON domain-containing protein [Gemmataceae bacterium]